MSYRRLTGRSLQHSYSSLSSRRTLPAPSFLRQCPLSLESSSATPQASISRRSGRLHITAAVAATASGQGRSQAPAPPSQRRRSLRQNPPSSRRRPTETAPSQLQQPPSRQKPSVQRMSTRRPSRPSILCSQISGGNQGADCDHHTRKSDAMSMRSTSVRNHINPTYISVTE